MDQIIYNYDKITNLDVILLALNIYDPNSIEQYKCEKLEELNEYFMFRGFTTLVGIATEKILKKDYPEIKISRETAGIPASNQVSRNWLWQFK